MAIRFRSGLSQARRLPSRNLKSKVIDQHATVTRCTCTDEALEGFLGGYRDVGRKLKGIRDVFANI